MTDEQPEARKPALGAVPWGQIVAVVIGILLAALLPVSRFLMGYGQMGRALLLGSVGVLALLGYLPVTELTILLLLWHDRKKVSVRGRIGRGLLLLVLPAAFGIVYLIPRDTCFEAGVKYRVEEAGGVEQLQSWAVRTVEAERANPGKEEIRELETLPDHVHDLRPAWDMAYVDVRHSVVVVMLGNRDFRLSLVVGSASYVPTQEQAPYLERLWDGVYLCRRRSWHELRFEERQE